MFCSGWYNTSYRYKTSHSQLDNKSITGTPILHVEASFISVERGLPRDLEPNLSQILHSFLIHSKAYNFIYKQLKRPVAFSVVHFDIKPQIVILQNNFFTLNLFNHESFCSQRLWKHQQKTYSPIGSRTNQEC